MLVINIAQSNGSKRVQRFSQTEVRVGRDADNDLVVSHDGVSRHHAIFEDRNGTVVLVDTSANGTFINDEQMIDEQILRASDVVTIGDVTLTASISREAPAAKATMPKGRLSVGEWDLGEERTPIKAAPAAPETKPVRLTPPLSTYLQRFVEIYDYRHLKSHGEACACGECLNCRSRAALTE